MSMLFYFTILKHHFINIPYHFTILLHRKTLFLLKYYFLTHSLLFLPNRSALYFPGLFNSHFYFSLPAPVQHTTHTHYTPIPSPHPHTQTQTQPSNKAKPHTQTQTHSKTGPLIKNPGQATDPCRRSTNPRRRFETQATDQKPEQTHSKKSSPEQTQSNPFKKNHHRSKSIQTHSKNIITGATEQTHSIKSSPEPSEQIHSKK